jgi:alpha-L-fucosidase 2
MKVFSAVLWFQFLIVSAFAQIPGYKNIWTKAPVKIPFNASVDAPLMGNGDVTMSVGYKENSLSFYLTKNDFWRLRSKADGLSGPRVVGILGLKIEGLEDADFTAEQLLSNGMTTSSIKNNQQTLEAKSWVSATDNLIFIKLKAIGKAVTVSIGLTAPENNMAKTDTGKSGDTDWLTRAFRDSVDIPTTAAVALKVLNSSQRVLVVNPGKPLTIVLAIGSNFKQADPLGYVLNRIKKIDENSLIKIEQQHDNWWKEYWGKSSITVQDSVLMKAYYQGLYTMAACSRDPEFPPPIFGWTTSDSPNWNGDYHLNYNFQAPFYGLPSANRLQQAVPHDAPLLAFMPRGEWYAKNVTQTRGILYPVGIGPLGIEVTKDFKHYINGRDAEQGGLFFGQRSNAAYGLLNMAQYWRSTYDVAYGKKIYPYALAVVNFWEDYLKYEQGRYVIYGDAIHEGSGKDKNPILSVGLIRNAFDLMIDLSSSLQRDLGRQEKWKDILTKLSDFPVQTRNGQKVFRYTEEGTDWWDGNGLGIQHIYPASTITLDSKEELLMISRNTIGEMNRWHDANTSNSFFVAAIRVGYDPAIILRELHKYSLRTYPNGFQLNNPHGIENSCTVENALNEMLCMSAGNVIRLFNIPKGQDASFHNIRTWGAFLISARLNNGLISDVKIRSEKGKPCTMINPWKDKKVSLIRNGKKAETLSGNRISFNTTRNETLELQLQK